MLPTIKPGDLLLIKPSQSYNQKITTNEIMVFIRDKHIICHRVLYNFYIGRLKYYLEKEDNNLFAWIIRSNKILGIVAEIDGNAEISPLSKKINGNNTFLKAIVFGLYGKIFIGFGKRNDRIRQYNKS
ncbi:MAG: S26 family signal peptidase [Candidatus Marinimicrobia bacterium]|nr:S26 family signal peptidase [Candidatus Neomarinimicrobiota bacterium]